MVVERATPEATRAMFVELGACPAKLHLREKDCEDGREKPVLTK